MFESFAKSAELLCEMADTLDIEASASKLAQPDANDAAFRKRCQQRGTRAAHFERFLRTYWPCPPARACELLEWNMNEEYRYFDASTPDFVTACNTWSRTIKVLPFQHVYDAYVKVAMDPKFRASMY